MYGLGFGVQGLLHGAWCTVRGFTGVCDEGVYLIIGLCSQAVFTSAIYYLIIGLCSQAVFTSAIYYLIIGLCSQAVFTSARFQRPSGSSMANTAPLTR